MWTRVVATALVTAGAQETTLPASCTESQWEKGDSWPGWPREAVRQLPLKPPTLGWHSLSSRKLQRISPENASWGASRCPGGRAGAPHLEPQADCLSSQHSPMGSHP